MKKLTGILAMFFFVVSLGQAQNDAITKYFEKYMDDDRFSVVYISPKMFELVSKIEIDEMGPEVQEVIRELKGLRILNTSENAVALFKEATEKINMNEYELLLTARDNNENVRIMVKDEGDMVNELLMVVGGETEFTMISFIGNIDLKKVGKIANMLEIDGMNHLKKLDDQNNKNEKKN